MHIVYPLFRDSEIAVFLYGNPFKSASASAHNDTQGQGLPLAQGPISCVMISFSSCEFPREEGHQPKLLLDIQTTNHFKVAIFSSHSATWMMELLRRFWCFCRKSTHTTRVMPHWSQSCQLESPLVKTNQFFLNQADQFFFKSATFLNADDSQNNHEYQGPLTGRFFLRVKFLYELNLTPKRACRKPMSRRQLQDTKQLSVFVRDRWQQPSRAATKWVD